MAKKRGGLRRKFNLRRVRVTPTLALSTLAAATALTVGLTGNADGAYRCVSIKQTWSIKEMTAGQGPILFGYSHSDYTVAEIKEAIEAAAAISVGNKIAQEQANRLVRLVGSFQPDDTGEQEFNDGEPVSTKLNWLIPIGKEVDLFVYNDDTSDLTTGGRVSASGDMWVKDST